MIRSSLEWSSRRVEIETMLRSMPYNRELRVMLNNIDVMVNNLSRAEVVARRTKRDINSFPELNAVNSAIDTLEQWIIMGKLLA